MTSPCHENGPVWNDGRVTRSAFYFYFPNTAVAVAELMGEVYASTLLAASEWFTGGVDHRRLDELRDGLQLTASRWRAKPGLMVAMLAAAGADADVRNVWQGWVQEFADRAATRIARDLKSGVARPDIEADAMAMTLVGATFHTMEHDVRAMSAGDTPSSASIDALVDVWTRSFYREP